MNDKKAKTKKKITNTSSQKEVTPKKVGRPKKESIKDNKKENINVNKKTTKKVSTKPKEKVITKVNKPKNTKTKEVTKSRTSKPKTTVKKKQVIMEDVRDNSKEKEEQELDNKVKDKIVIKKEKDIKNFIIVSLVCVLLIELVYGSLLICKALTKKFVDVNIELGTESLKIEDFLKDKNNAKNSKFITDISLIDLNKLGKYKITLSYNGEEETVTLNIVDTKSPKVTFKDVHSYIDYVINPYDFIETIDDLQDVEVTVDSDITIDTFKTYKVKVVVTDASGNKTSKNCKLYIEWLKSELTLELGTPLTKEMLLLNPSLDSNYLTDEELSKVNYNQIGEYSITATKDGVSFNSLIKVIDTTAPNLELKEVTIYNDATSVDINSFIASVSDLSGDVKTEILTEIKYGEVGTQEVSIKATDVNGNDVTQTTNLNIIADTEGPLISGLTNITIGKNGKIDYYTGVSAYDAKYGPVEYSVDSSKVNVSAAGTYYATYTAKDPLGNVTTSKRKITVRYDSTDVTALVKSIASSLSSDPLALKNYCKNKITYSHNDGGNDPLYYGLVNKNGNCYVHAMCLKALLDEKGIENQLIWVTNKTHYWNLIKVNGSWYHIDSTPGPTHQKIPGLMNDAQRYSTLSGRDWDRSAWPASN